MAVPVYKQKIDAFNYNFDIDYHNISNYDLSSMLFCKNILEHESRCIINHVMRNNDGDLVEVVVDNKLYLGCIENVKSDISILIKKELKIDLDFIPKVNLIIPILKEQKMDLILQKACELGVSKITILPLKRCIVKVDEKKIKSKLDRWNRILKEASEQSFRYNIPSVEFVDSIKYLSDLDGLKIVCSTKKNLENVKMVLKKNKKCDTINVVIGPEGGLDDAEEIMLNKLGFISTTLGNRIMRVESVPLFMMSIINYEYLSVN